MRFIVLAVVFLALSGWTLAHWPQPMQMPAQADFTWRRTAAGWERMDRWPKYHVPRYEGHPLLLGSFQLGVSVLALMAGADAERHRARRRNATTGQSVSTGASEAFV